MHAHGGGDSYWSGKFLSALMVRASRVRKYSNVGIDYLPVVVLGSKPKKPILANLSRKGIFQKIRLFAELMGKLESWAQKLG